MVVEVLQQRRERLALQQEGRRSGRGPRLAPVLHRRSGMASWHISHAIQASASLRSPLTGPQLARELSLLNFALLQLRHDAVSDVARVQCSLACRTRPCIMPLPGAAKRHTPGHAPAATQGDCQPRAGLLGDLVKMLMAVLNGRMLAMNKPRAKWPSIQKAAVKEMQTKDQTHATRSPVLNSPQVTVGCQAAPPLLLPLPPAPPPPAAAPLPPPPAALAEMLGGAASPAPLALG